MASRVQEMPPSWSTPAQHEMFVFVQLVPHIVSHSMVSTCDLGPWYPRPRAAGLQWLLLQRLLHFLVFHSLFDPVLFSMDGNDLLSLIQMLIDI